MSGARNRLLSELKAIQKLNWLRVEASDDNLFVWRIALVVVNPDSDFAGGYFTGEIRFPADYPYKPPSFRFTTPIFHPNIYANGNICISILHNPGDDVMSGEQAGERWSPLQGVESVMLSILLLLDNPEINSPANVDASVCYRDNKATYRAQAKRAVEASRQAMPADFVMPTKFDDDEAAARNKPGHDAEDDNAFWADSDEGDFDFGSDDSDDEQEFDEDCDDDEANGSHSHS